MKRLVILILALSALSLNACAPNMISKQEAFPEMYEKQPVALLVLPPINQSTAADARNYYATTIAQPLADKGYYVFPIEVVSEVLRQEGVPDTELLLDSNPGVFKEHFNADAVLFIVINKWDTNYYVVGGNVTVQMGYILKDTESGDVIWRYNDTVVVDTSGQNRAGGIAGLVLAAVETAVKTAMTDYVPVAKQVNAIAVTCLPYGKYHPQCGKDGGQKVVLESKVRPQ